MSTALIKTLINFAERAGKLAHIIREDPTLFSLLVQEKGEEEKNKKFTQDFKTLADVLIQESLRYYVKKNVSLDVSLAFIFKYYVV